MQEIVIGSGLTLTADTLTADGGTGFDVEVNGTLIIPPATLLDLKSGTDIDVIHEGGGVVRFDYVGSAAGYNGNQGVYKDTSLTPETFMLGAPSYAGAVAEKFLQNRFIYTDTNSLQILGVRTEESPSYVVNIVNEYTGDAGEALRLDHYGPGIGLNILQDKADQANTGMTGVNVFAANQPSDPLSLLYTTGIRINDFIGNDEYRGIKIDSSSTNTIPIYISRNEGPSTVANAIERFMLLERMGTAANGRGGSIDFKIVSSTNGAQDSNKLISKWSDFTNATRTSQFEIQGVNNGAAIATQLTLKGTGQLQLNNYTTATSFDPESGPSIGVLNVDNVGNVFVGPGGEGNTYTVNNGLSPDPGDPNNFQLGGLLVGDTSISGDGNTHSLTFDDMNILSGSSNFKIAFSANDGTTTSSFALQPTIANIGCGVNGSGSASFADFTDTESRLGYLTATQTVEFGADATGLYVKTPDVATATATAGQVLTLINATTGESEWADGGGGGGAAVGGRSYYFNGSVNQGTFAGIANMKQLSPVPISGAGTNFTISTNGYIESFITNLGDPNKVLIPAGNWNFELWFRASSGGGTPSFYIELYKYDTVGLSLSIIATGSGAPEAITGGAVADLYFTALSVPQTTLATTDRLAVRVFVNNGGGGRTITLFTEDSRFSQIITSFPSGIQSLNGLTGVAQTFATPGTSGTAPSWTSAGTTHTIDIPLASAASVTAGLISKTEYDTFNGKVGPTRAISTTAPLSGGGNLSADLTLSIPLATNSVDGYLSATDRAAFNAKQAAITGAATTITTSDLTADKALISNAGGKVAASSSVVGYRLATLTDPNDVRYLRINSDNTVATLTLAQLKTDLSVGTDISVVLASLVTNVGTGFEDVTGLSFAVTAGKTYKWRATISYAATAGITFSSNGPTASLNNARFTTSLAATTNAVSNQTTYDGGTNAAVAANGLSTADGIFRVTASGTWTIRFRCATAGLLTVRAGSVLEYSEVL
jgi:hypothetical protein